MKRPLVIVALLYMGGILLGRQATLSLSFLLGVGFILAGAALFLLKVRSILLFPLIAITGWVGYEASTLSLSPHDLRHVAGASSQDLTIRGTINQKPVYHQAKRGSELLWRSSTYIDVNRINRGNHWEPVTGEIVVSTPGLLSDRFFAGQLVEVAGLLQKPRSLSVGGLFDYEAYLRDQNVHYQLSTRSTNDWKLLSVGASSAELHRSDQFFAWAQACMARGLPVEDEPLRLLWAMMLGWKTGLTTESSEPFMQSGTLHVFAISGLHIALFAGILVSLLRVVQVPRSWCGLVSIPLLWFYTGATGWQSSAIRSTIMATVIIVGWALRRPSDLINSLAAAAIVILAWEPQQLFQPGFQLSFAVVWSIAALLGPLEKAGRNLVKPDPLLPEELRPNWQKWLTLPVRHLIMSMATSLAAWLGSLPIIAYYFYMITPGSLLANLIVVPLSSLALMSSFASLVFGAWLPILSELFNHGAWFWMKSMIGVSQWVAQLPGAYHYVRPASLSDFTLYYSILGICCSGWLLRPNRRLWAAGGISVLISSWLVVWKMESNITTLSILPLGGSALFFDAPGSANDLLIDCGNENQARFIVKTFLRSRGVNRLNSVLLTHGDIQHVGGLEFLESQFSFSRIVTNPLRFRSIEYRQIVQRLETDPDRWRLVERGKRVGNWSVLHPEAQDQFKRADDGTIVLRGNVNGTRVLLLSDLGQLGQITLLQREKDLAADILVAGLSSDGEPLNPRLLAAVQPRLIIIADPDYPPRAKASSKVRGRLAGIGVPVYYTSETGAITVTFDSAGWKLNTVKETEESQSHEQDRDIDKSTNSSKMQSASLRDAKDKKPDGDESF